MKTKLSEPERERAAQLVALFSVLIHAWRTNNFAEAGNAQSELAKAGIRVQLPRRNASTEGRSHA